jgi:hypothetical protein
VATLACGANVPTCSSWDFETGTEGWKVGSYYPSPDDNGLITGLSTMLNNGSQVLTAKFDNRSGAGRAAQFSVDLCPGAAIVNLSNYVFKYDLFLRTTGGSKFMGFDSNGGVGPDTFLANGGSVLTACQPFLYPASDTWEEEECGSLPATATNMTIIIRFSNVAWAGDIYIDNVRFEPR